MTEERCFLEGRDGLDAEQRKWYEKSINAWQLEAGACEGEIRGRYLVDDVDMDGDKPVALCARHFPMFAAHLMVKGARVRAVKGRKIKPGSEGVIRWTGHTPSYRNPRSLEARIGVVPDGSDEMVFADPYNFTVVAPPEPRTATCERCGQTFTDGVSGDSLATAFEIRREHEREAHPRPTGPRIDKTENDTYFDRRGQAIWATCAEHGMVRPYVVEWEGWTRGDGGKWERETYAIAIAERVTLKRTDGSDSTVQVDQTYCEKCLAPSMLRTIKPRKLSPEALKRMWERREKRDAELIYCDGACTHGKVNCDCFCLGQCHGAARGGLGQALELEAWGRVYAEAKKAGDEERAAHAQRELRKVYQVCPGHPRWQVKHFYGIASE